MSQSQKGETILGKKCKIKPEQLTKALHINENRKRNKSAKFVNIK